MTRAQKICISTGVTLVGTVLAVWCALGEMALSVAPELTAPFILPYAFLTVHVFSADKWPFLFFAFAQYPAYGAILTWAWVRNREVRVGWRLLVFHTLFGIGCTLLYLTDTM